MHIPSKLRAAGMSAAACVLAFSFSVAPAEAQGKKKQPRTPAVFDIDQRKRAKTQISSWLSGSLYANFRFLGEQNRRREDNNNDHLMQFITQIGVTGRAKLGDQGTAFLNAEIAREDKFTDFESSGRIDDPQIKEALVSFSISENTQLTAGRLRFSDRHKWVADASVDGVHFVSRADDALVEVAIVTGTRNIEGDYLIAHASRFSERTTFGAFAVAEQTKGESSFHLSGYYHNDMSADFSYQLNVGGVFGDGANDEPFGAGLDFRALKKVGHGTLNPQVTLGFAIGSPGYRQTGLHSNKTRDGGQTQFHRYGDLYQPELSNIAIASLAYGLRPSRSFSIDFGLHAYLQPRLSTTGPDARIRGDTNGISKDLGAEISISGAWRPTRSAKIDFGLARFFPGQAYLDQSNADRIYFKFSKYF